MAIIKCTQLKGLADKSDYTCKSRTPTLCRAVADLSRWNGRSRHVDQVCFKIHPTDRLLTSDSIESNVVIVASCIPTLQPILELILGKRSLASYSNNSSRQKNSKYMHSTSYVRSRRSMIRKPDPTITDIESQESILHAEGDQHLAHPLGQIRRTDNVTVEYETRTSNPDRSPSW